VEKRKIAVRKFSLNHRVMKQLHFERNADGTRSKPASVRMMQVIPNEK
jgi:hypothetical protein